eukprot:scaffold7373_cov232-Pinguiococcus_pyrenoidosus.AAC.4
MATCFFSSALPGKIAFQRGSSRVKQAHLVRVLRPKDSKRFLQLLIGHLQHVAGAAAATATATAATSKAACAAGLSIGTRIPVHDLRATRGHQALLGPEAVAQGGLGLGLAEADVQLLCGDNAKAAKLTKQHSPREHALHHVRPVQAVHAV